MIRSRTIFLHCLCAVCEDDPYVVWSFEIQGFQEQNYWNNDFVSCCFAVAPTTTFTRCLHSITECSILSFAHVPNTLMFCHCHFLSCHTIRTANTHSQPFLSYMNHYCMCRQDQTLQRRTRQFGGEIMFPESWTQVNACMHLHELEIKNCTVLLCYRKVSCNLWAACCWCS
jgi:hypothetical protein